MRPKRKLFAILLLLLVMVAAVEPVFAMPESCANALSSPINPWGGGSWLWWGAQCAMDLNGWADPFNM